MAKAVKVNRRLVVLYHENLHYKYQPLLETLLGPETTGHQDHALGFVEWHNLDAKKALDLFRKAKILKQRFGMHIMIMLYEKSPNPGVLAEIN